MSCRNRDLSSFYLCFGVSPKINPKRISFARLVPVRLASSHCPHVIHVHRSRGGRKHFSSSPSYVASSAHRRCDEQSQSSAQISGAKLFFIFWVDCLNLLMELRFCEGYAREQLIRVAIFCRMSKKNWNISPRRDPLCAMGKETCKTKMFSRARENN